MTLVTAPDTVDFRDRRFIFSWSSAIFTGAVFTAMPAPRSRGWVTLRVAMSVPWLTPPPRRSRRDHENWNCAPVGISHVAVGVRMVVVVVPGRPPWRDASMLPDRRAVG